MRTLLFIAAILPVFLWVLGLFAVAIAGVAVADHIASSLIGAADAFRPQAARRRHALR